MEEKERLSPELMEAVERGLRHRGHRPSAPGGSTGYAGDDPGRRGRLAGLARLGMVPILLGGRECFKHKDDLVPEDVPLMVAWQEAETERWEARAERALFACEVLGGLEDLEPEPGGRPERASRGRVRDGLAFLARLAGRRAV